MPSAMIRVTMLASLLVLHVCGPASTCRANWFSDCFGCQRTAAYPNTATTCYAVGNTCNPATPTVLQQRLVNFAPQTTYQTRWTTIPVTSYRPITTTDPVTGCTVTCMRPCTSYQLQARRVPVTHLRPVYSTIAVNTAPLPTYYAQPATQYAVPQEAGCGSELPYYGNSGGISPSRAAPADFPSLQSAPGIPASPAAPNGSPADRPPTLDPSRLQGAAPSNNPYRVRLLPVVPGAAASREAGPESAIAAPAQAVAPALTEIEDHPVPMREVPSLEVPSREVPSREVPSTVPVTRPPLRPIPDPDELNLEPATGTPSPNSRDKVALRSPTSYSLPVALAAVPGKIVPISWPTGSRNEAPVRTAKPSLERPQTGPSPTELQDTGWTSIRP
jgi:hypothetical protein